MTSGDAETASGCFLGGRKSQPADSHSLAGAVWPEKVTGERGRFLSRQTPWVWTLSNKERNAVHKQIGRSHTYQFSEKPKWLASKLCS